MPLSKRLAVIRLRRLTRSYIASETARAALLGWYSSDIAGLIRSNIVALAESGF